MLLPSAEHLDNPLAPTQINGLEGKILSLWILNSRKHNTLANYLYILI